MQVNDQFLWCPPPKHVQDLFGFLYVHPHLPSEAATLVLTWIITAAFQQSPGILPTSHGNSLQNANLITTDHI